MRVLEFGAEVVVSAEVVRVIGKLVDDQVVYRQAGSSRDLGRYVRHDFDGDGPWPGAPIGVDWEPSASKGFDAQQPVVDGTVLVRLRRVIYRVPEIGIVIGRTRRQEGRILGGKAHGEVDGEPAQLAGPGRTVNLVELALQPQGSTKARIVLAHQYDLQPVRAHQQARSA